MQRKKQSWNVTRDPMRHKLRRQTFLGVEATIDDRLERLVGRQAHLGPLGVVIHADVVRTHQQRRHCLGR